MMFAPSRWFILFWSLLSTGLSSVAALTRCFSFFDCERSLKHNASECIDGYCSNPYFRGGCLALMDPESHFLRTCNSEDPPEAAEKGYCRPSAMNYPEVRISSQNWESVFFEAWILQIILSEILDVPVTIETGSADVKVNFYDPETSFDYGIPNDWESVRMGNSIKDCRKVKELPNYPDEYVACTHVVPEVWTGHSNSLETLKKDKQIEAPSGLGALGAQSWFIPKFTAQNDTSLLSYLGIQGEENRHKLASTFLRPTTWGDYCLYETVDNCQTSDDTARRPPEGSEQANSYFFEPDFQGYFKFTEQNNCTKWPNNCTGHIVDFPCGWASYVSQIAHHLNIAVESNGKEPGSNGYSYASMTQIWAAANATQSNVMMQWWSPEALYQEYLGTDFEFTRVNLPPPTQTCIENRVDPLDRCSPDPVVRVGDPRGACAEAPHSLLKVISTALYEMSYSPDLPSAVHSPAYETIKNFRITDLQLGEIFNYWFEESNKEHGDKWNLAPREAVCNWFVEHFEEMMAYVPESHPRRIEENKGVYDKAIYYISIIISCLAMTAVLVATTITYRQRNKQVMRFAQIEFLFLLLMGLMLVALGSLFNAIRPTDARCVSVVWLVNFGYTMELVPLIVKVAALNRLMVAAQQMKRVQLNVNHLYLEVLIIAILVGGYLIAWTATDPPSKSYDLELTDKTTDIGHNIVQQTYYCESDNIVWSYVSISWQLLLLLSASVLAFQTRRMSEDINETRTLAMLIYSQFVFVILRTVTIFLESSVDQSDLTASRSILLSCDVVATIAIYFVPKFMHGTSSAFWSKARPQETRSSSLQGRMNVHHWEPPRPKRPPIDSGSSSEDEDLDQHTSDAPTNYVHSLSLQRGGSLENKRSTQNDVKKSRESSGRLPSVPETDDELIVDVVANNGDKNDDETAKIVKDEQLQTGLVLPNVGRGDNGTLDDGTGSSTDS